MNDPWFNPILYAWIPGTVYGSLLGMVGGGLCGTLAQAGRARKLVMAILVFFLAAGVALLGFGLAALVLGQPYGIWYGLLMPGILGAILLPIMIRQIRSCYRQAEERRMQAVDLQSRGFQDH